MKKKKYIREGGICQFWDNWAENGSINHQKLSRAIFHPETIEQHKEHSEESYIVEAIVNSKETTKETNKENTPFNIKYKDYEQEN
jgi:hypothetical protein